MSYQKTYTLTQARTSGIHTLEIAAAFVDGLTAQLADSSINVVARGIANKPAPGGDDVQFPGILIEVSEGMPKEHNSRRHAFGVKLELTTLFQRDQTQGVLYGISQSMRRWLATATLSLHSSTFQAIRHLSPPRSEPIEHYQTMEFDLACDALLPEAER